MGSPVPRFESLRRARRVAPLAMAVAMRTGLWPHLGPGGLRVLALGLAQGRTNPSLLYRFQAAVQPDKVAVRWRGREVTFRHLDEQIDGIGRGLRARGLGR
ncbi:MAG: hypothetical protein CVU63_13735, partial [Deltaproteobacteria bacterium HGW-Deltaproteobacteria-20]